MIVILVIAVIYAYNKFYVGSSLEYRMTNLFMGADEGDDIRGNMYENAFELLKEKFITGFGFRGYSVYYEGNAGGYSHATYAELPACTGIVDASFILGCIFALYESLS